MPPSKGTIAPQNTFIDTIIKKFDYQKRKYLIANAQVPNKPIIYVNDAFCNLVKFSRSQIMQKPCYCEFLYGPLTSNASRNFMLQALSHTEETQMVINLYPKGCDHLLCNVIIAPVKNERGEVILFILNFDTLNPTNDNIKYNQVLNPNRLINLKFISGIFNRNKEASKLDDLFSNQTDQQQHLAMKQTSKLCNLT
jgi:hypothetical protein